MYYLVKLSSYIVTHNKIDCDLVLIVHHIQLPCEQCVDIGDTCNTGPQQWNNNGSQCVLTYNIRM